MYWDNDKIADSYFAESARKEETFSQIQASYLNDLFVISATWIFGDNAFRKDGEYKKITCRLINNIDDSVWKANKTIDTHMEIDDDYTLSMIEEDEYIQVVGMTTGDGAFLVEEAFDICKEFGEVIFMIK